jgi:hypothetical protein
MVDSKGQKRSDDTHESVTDPDARLRRKGGAGAKLVHMGHLLTENRNGLAMAAGVFKAEGNDEIDAALAQLAGCGQGTVGADKGYDQGPFVDGGRALGITPHVAQNESGSRSSSIDGRTTCHPGYRAHALTHGAPGDPGRIMEGIT